MLKYVSPAFILSSVTDCMESSASMRTLPEAVFSAIVDAMREAGFSVVSITSSPSSSTFDARNATVSKLASVSAEQPGNAAKYPIP